VGYKRLIDTYHPDEYRMACYVGPFEPDVLSDNKAGQFELMFSCKPQRYLLSGENIITLTSSGTIYNPTLFDAQPLMRVYGHGDIIFGSMYPFVEISETIYPYIDIDFAAMEAYYGDLNCNEFISVSDNDFPVIHPGSTTITLSGNITKVEITPRWWQV
jgi:phage-related protein